MLGKFLSETTAWISFNKHGFKYKRYPYDLIKKFNVKFCARVYKQL